MRFSFLIVVVALMVTTGCGKKTNKNTLKTKGEAVIPGVYEDDYWLEPQGDYEERKQIYLDYASQDHRNIGGRQGLFSQIA